MYDSEAPATFPLYLRIPSWCDNTEIAIDNQQIALTVNKSGFVRLTREWSKRKKSLSDCRCGRLLTWAMKRRIRESTISRTIDQLRH